MTNETEDRIRRRAYAIWEKEGRPEGQDKRHWEQAMREIQAEKVEEATELLRRPDETEPEEISQASTISPDKSEKAGGK